MIMIPVGQGSSSEGEGVEATPFAWNHATTFGRMSPRLSFGQTYGLCPIRLFLSEEEAEDIGRNGLVHAVFFGSLDYCTKVFGVPLIHACRPGKDVAPSSAAGLDELSATLLDLSRSARAED